MLVNVKKIDEQYLKCIFKVYYEDFDKALSKVFIETKDKYKIPGMETGKIPKPLIESYYGETVLYEDTLNYLVKKEFEKMTEEYNKYNITEDKVEDVYIIQLEKGRDVKFEITIKYK